MPRRPGAPIADHSGHTTRRDTVLPFAKNVMSTKEETERNRQRDEGIAPLVGRAALDRSMDDPYG